MFKIGVFAIIFNDQQRVLLCHRRDHDLWNLPGGAMETGETPWQAVVREVKEETGLEVSVEKLLGVYSKPDKNEIVFSFLCQIVSGTVILTDEADQIEYYDPAQLPANTVPKQVERIKDAIISKGLVLKVQTGPSVIDSLNQS